MVIHTMILSAGIHFITGAVLFITRTMVTIITPEITGGVTTILIIAVIIIQVKRFTRKEQSQV